jgi:hypothetical protein
MNAMIIKAGKVGGAITLGAFLLGASTRSHADGTGPDYQRTLAANCEQRAAATMASLNEVMKLKADNLKQWQLRKSPPNREIAEADKRYDAQIAELREKFTQYQELANLHKLQAEVETANLPGSSRALD